MSTRLYYLETWEIIFSYFLYPKMILQIFLVLKVVYVIS